MAPELLLTCHFIFFRDINPENNESHEWPVGLESKGNGGKDKKEGSNKKQEEDGKT